jgi:hypothetical protein
MRSSFGPATSTPKTVNDLKARSPWFGLVPNPVAEQQVAWERREAVTRMRHLGYTINEIAKQWCTSSAMISYLLRHQANKGRAPIAKWLADETDVLALAKLIRRTALEQLIDNNGTDVHSVVSDEPHQQNALVASIGRDAEPSSSASESGMDQR